VRLTAIKNADPTKESVPLKLSKDGAEAYHPNVVLDLDYWLLMPKQRS
jgi:hypothetical protein